MTERRIVVTKGSRPVGGVPKAHPVHGRAAMTAPPSYIDDQRRGPRSARISYQLKLLVRATRPRQIIKNLVVPAAPFAAGELVRAEVVLTATVAVIAFSAAAAGIYLLNDVIDAKNDRAHPTKRLRPVASRLLSPYKALATAVPLLVVAELVSFVASPRLALVTAVYIQLQIVYCLWIRRQPVFDICLVATGFVLRVIAGAVATSVPLSVWLLCATAFWSLFMVSGRRYSEVKARDKNGRNTRSSLNGYSLSYLRFVWSSSATMSILAYLLWLSQTPSHDRPLFSGLAAAMFIVAMLRYALDIDRGTADTPEEIAFGDRALQTLALLWLVATTAAIYS